MLGFFLLANGGSPTAAPLRTDSCSAHTIRTSAKPSSPDWLWCPVLKNAIREVRYLRGKLIALGILSLGFLSGYADFLFDIHCVFVSGIRIQYTFGSHDRVAADIGSSKAACK